MTVDSNKKVQRSWAMYDWANSAYNLVITSTRFPAYYEAITSTKEGDKIINDKVEFFGRTFTNTALFDYALAAAYLVIAFLSPILSSIADYRGNKKRFMQLFCYIGSVACCGLYFFELSTLELGIILFAIAAIGYCGSLVFYNSYLPDIAYTDQQDAVSAKGYSLGYIGSVILLIVNLAMVMLSEEGAAQLQAMRWSFVMVGIWWILFSQYTYYYLPKGNKQGEKVTRDVMLNGFRELRKVWDQLTHNVTLKRYLGAFFVYSMAVQTVKLVAT